MSLAAHHPPARPPRRSQWLVDGFIAALVVVFALDTLPCTPEPVRQRLAPLLCVTGLWQGTWSLFAPVPDSRNYRLQADITLGDGTHRIWNSPDWRRQTAWQRFTRHRESEFLEQIWHDQNQAAWSALAKDVARREMLRLPAAATPDRVELSVIWYEVPPPDGHDWTRMPGPVQEQRRMFFTLVYPEIVP